LLASNPTPKLEDHPLSLSMAAYSVYSQLSSIAGGLSSIHNPRTCHAVVTGNHRTCVECRPQVLVLYLASCYTVLFNGYCRLCFCQRAVLLCRFSLSVTTCFGLHSHLQVCRIVIFICSKRICFAVFFFWFTAFFPKTQIGNMQSVTM
jgi:hypothetical protein